MDNSDKLAKDMCIEYLTTMGYHDFHVSDTVKHCCDVIGKKDGITYYFEIKSSSRRKNESFGGTVMLTELNKAISNKDTYRFIVCKGIGSKLANWEFHIFEVDEFIKYCALTTPILRYAYHPDPKKQPKFRKKTRTVNDLLIENMWNAFSQWTNTNNTEVEPDVKKEILKATQNSDDTEAIKEIIYEKEITKTDIERGLLVISPIELSSLSKYKGEEMWIKDGNIDFSPYLLYNDKDKNNLRFGGLKEWYHARKIRSGTKINIFFNENEIENNLHVIHIEYI